MKTELKLVENPSGFRKYGICCNSDSSEQFARKGEILRQYVKGENTDTVCFHRPLVAYTEANPSAKAQFC